MKKLKQYDAWLLEKLITRNYCSYFKIPKEDIHCQSCRVKIQCEKVEENFKKKLIKFQKSEGKIIKKIFKQGPREKVKLGDNDEKNTI
jgi:hypothetical protein